MLSISSAIVTVALAGTPQMIDHAGLIHLAQSTSPGPVAGTVQGAGEVGKGTAKGVNAAGEGIVRGTGEILGQGKVVKGTGTVAKGAVKGTAEVGKGVVKGAGKVGKGVAKGAGCIVTLGRSC